MERRETLSRRELLNDFIGAAGMQILPYHKAPTTTVDSTLELSSQPSTHAGRPFAQESLFRTEQAPPDHLFVFDRLVVSKDKLLALGPGQLARTTRLVVAEKDPHTNQRRLKELATFPSNLLFGITASRDNPQIIIVLGENSPYSPHRGQIVFTQDGGKSWINASISDVVSAAKIAPGAKEAIVCKITLFGSTHEKPLIRLDLTTGRTLDMPVRGIDQSFVTSPTSLELDESGVLKNYALVNKHAAQLTYTGTEAQVRYLPSIPNSDMIAGFTQEGKKILWVVNNLITKKNDYNANFAHVLHVGTILEYSDEQLLYFRQPLLSLYPELFLPGYQETDVLVRATYNDTETGFRFMGVDVLRLRSGDGWPPVYDVFPNIEILIPQYSRVLIPKDGAWPQKGSIGGLRVARNNNRKYLTASLLTSTSSGDGLYERDITKGIDSQHPWYKLRFNFPVSTRIYIPGVSNSK